MIGRNSVVATFVLFSTYAHAEVSTGQLLQTCQKKTQVWGRVGSDLKVVGERMDGFCEGYLVASYHALVASGAIHSNLGGVEVTGELLKSVLEVYVKENPSASNQTASTAIVAAYSRAFPQKRKK